MTVTPAILLLAALLSSAVQQSTATTDDPCGRAADDVAEMLHDMSPTGTRGVHSRVANASTLFRMRRRTEALTALDNALALFDLTRRRLTAAAERERVGDAIGGLRRCIGTSTPPLPATLTVRTYLEDERRADAKGAPAAAGALVRINEMAVGHTAAGGIFKGRVPSGVLRVTAEVPPSQAGAADVTLAPGAVGVASIVLQSSKEIAEETPLVVAEADGGILSASARTFTLTFVPSTGVVTIRKINEINLLGLEGNSDADLTRMFKVERGAIAAVDPAEVIRTIRARSSGLVVLSVDASDGTTVHASRVEFRIE